MLEENKIEQDSMFTVVFVLTEMNPNIFDSILYTEAPYVI